MICIFVILIHQNIIFFFFLHFENDSYLFLHMNSCCQMKHNIHSHCSLKKIKSIFVFPLLFSFSQSTRLISSVLLFYLSISFCICAGHSLNSPWQKPLKHVKPSFKPRPLHQVCCCQSCNYS